MVCDKNTTYERFDRARQGFGARVRSSMILLQRSLRCLAVVGFVLLLVLDNVLADAPLPPPGLVRQVSRDFNIGAESDPQTNETIVYRQNRGPQGGMARGETLWKFPRWFRAFQVSNDGSTIVAQGDYLNLLPPEIAQDNYVLLTFIVRGKVIREVTVKQLLGSRSKLVPTVSNLSWGQGLYGIDKNGFVLVDTVVGFFIFDAHTGKCIFPPNNQVDSRGMRGKTKGVRVGLH
jgi:hypothetical protein